jgi:hypothetical protein
MEIARERFLDETRQLHLSLTLRSRTTEMHSVLTALTTEQRDGVAAALARALDDISAIVRPPLAGSSLEGRRASTHGPSL